MIAWFMVRGGLPVYHGVCLIIVFGVALGMFATSFFDGLFWYIGEGFRILYYALPEDIVKMTITEGEYAGEHRITPLGVFIHDASTDLKTLREWTLISWGAGTYAFFEFVLFCMFYMSYEVKEVKQMYEHEKYRDFPR